MELVNAVGGVTSALVSLVALWLAWKAYAWSLLTHKSQQTLSRRQLILPLWEQLTKCRHVGADARAGQVMHHVNVLQLVAVCCLADAVDDDVVNAILGDDFIELYDEIEKVGSIELPGANGPEKLTGSEFLKRYGKLASKYRRRLQARRDKVLDIPPHV